MTRLVMIRHATTIWNENRRLQGRSDIALSAKGHRELKNWQIPKTYENGRWVCSPLLRAVQTARTLGATQLQCEPRLVEMNWGDWEGCTIDELQLNDPEYMNEVESRGLDFSAPNGESPRQIQQRLAPWLLRIANQSEPINAVCHKGVIKSLFAWAINWNLLGKSPIKLDWSSAQIFNLNENGAPSLEKSNVNLLSSSHVDGK